MVHKHHFHRRRRSTVQKDLIRREIKPGIEQERQHLRLTKSHPVTVEVQLLTGRKIALVVDLLKDSVLDIMEKIRSKEGIHPDMQILLYNGLILTVGSTAQELQLHDKSLMFLSIRNRGG